MSIVWLNFAILGLETGFYLSKWQNMTKPWVYLERARRPCSNRLLLLNLLNFEVFAACTLTINLPENEVIQW